MSIKVMTRVWEQADYKGGALLLLLALADHSDETGISWPGIAVLSRKARLTERQTISLLHNLVNEGALDVITIPGRGNRSSYAILVGLDTQAQENLKFFHRKKFSEIVSMKSVQEKPEISDTKNLKSVQKTEAAFTAPQQPETPQKQNNNRHVEPSLEPREDKARKRALRSPQETQASLLDTPLGIYRQVTNHRNPNQAQRELIEVVTDLEAWRATCEQFAVSGWNVRNVPNLIDAYNKRVREKKRIASLQAPPVNGTNGYHSVPTAAIPEGDEPADDSDWALTFSALNGIGKAHDSTSTDTAPQPGSRKRPDRGPGHKP